MQRRVEGIKNKKETIERTRKITEQRELIEGEDFYNYGITIKELYFMIKEKWFSQGGKLIKCSICEQGLNLTEYCPRWKGDKMGEEERKWVNRCRQEGQIYMVGISRETTEQIMKKGRRIKNRLREFAQKTKEEIEEIKWNIDYPSIYLLRKKSTLKSDLI